jgi:hypothetical protein
LKHPDFAMLSPRATKLLLDVAVEYNGKNNGDLNAVLSRLKNRGWNSSSQLSKAKVELLERGMIVETRQGGLIVGPSLYALSWLDLDDCGGKLDLNPAIFKRRSFRSASPYAEQLAPCGGAVAA